jgi:chromosome segregation ATPase
MKKDEIRETLSKKMAALNTTQSEIAKAQSQIAKKQRTIEKAKLDIQILEDSISDKREAVESLEAKARFQQERIGAISMILGQAEVLDAERTEMLERWNAAGAWGMDLARMRAEKADPTSEYNVTGRRVDELNVLLEKLYRDALAEYHRIFVREEE